MANIRIFENNIFLLIFNCNNKLIKMSAPYNTGEINTNNNDVNAQKNDIPNSIPIQSFEPAIPLDNPVDANVDSHVGQHGDVPALVQTQPSNIIADQENNNRITSVAPALPAYEFKPEPIQNTIELMPHNNQFQQNQYMGNQQNIPYNNIDPQNNYVEQQPQQVVIVHKIKEVRVSSFPVVSLGVAIAVLLFNIFFPGIGTFILAAFSDDASNWICIGVVQLLTFWFLIGWVWAIMTGIQALAYSRSDL
jgi:hypothetical protein